MYFLPAPFKLTTEKSANHFILVLSERKEKLTIERWYLITIVIKLSHLNKKDYIIIIINATFPL